MDWSFLLETFASLVSAIPLTLELAATSIVLGAMLALAIALCRLSGIAPLEWFARSYVFVFRGTPLLVQIFLIYYGLGQIAPLRQSVLWPFLREPYWCAILALALNTSAYTAEIIRGAIQAVPAHEIEAGRACGMSGFLLRRRIIWPIALRQGLAVYGSEAILMIKATSLASIITLTELAGIAHKLISSTYRVFEIFIVTGAIYLALTFLMSTAFALLERHLQAHHAHRRA